MRAFSSNICHQDCLPDQCHGPLASQCEQCAGNKTLVTSRCQCREGYFDFGGNECSAYSQDCVEGTVAGDGSVTCTRCSHKM